MGTLRAAPKTKAKASPSQLYKSVFSKLTIAAGLLAAFASPEHISEIFLDSLSAAYTSVTVFVAATMIPIHFLGHKLNFGKFEPILENKYLGSRSNQNETHNSFVFSLIFLLIKAPPPRATTAFFSFM